MDAGGTKDKPVAFRKLLVEVGIRHCDGRAVPKS